MQCRMCSIGTDAPWFDGRRVGRTTEMATTALVLSALVGLLFASPLIPQPGSAAAPVRGSAAAPVRVGLFGDSLASEAELYFNVLVQAGGRVKVSDFTYGGTAACDWLPAMRRFARTDHPRAVVLEFIGNTFSPCMLGCVEGSRTAVHLYCSAISQALQSFLAVGTHVFLAGTPITRSEWVDHDPDWDDLNKAFAAFAAQHPKSVTYVDAGSAVEGPHHTYVATMPCLSFEPCGGPTIRGVRTNVVRSPDGVHFCPQETADATGEVSHCALYSSGAFRFAAAMAGPLIRELHLPTARSTKSRVEHPPPVRTSYPSRANSGDRRAGGR